MGKHNKVNRKNYWKRRKRRFTGRGNEEQCSSTCSKEEQNHGGLESDFDHADNDSEDQAGHSLQNYLDTSDNGSEYQNTLGIFDRFLTTPPVFGHARTDLWVEYRPIPRWTLKRSGA